jgi:oligoribonuclease NrnB/cAMP/cGMP phosphodiesterase (DHH superfamily)
MRLVTRGDLDGVTSAVLISTMEKIDDIELIHPQDITDKKFEVKSNDILANLPYHPECAMWFDHHEFTIGSERPPDTFKGRHEIAPSVARVIYEYYASDRLEPYEYLVKETDRFDSAQLTFQDVLNPKGIILLGFTIDARTGIGKFKEYFVLLVNWLKSLPAEEVLSQSIVKKRVQLLKENNEKFLKILNENSGQEGNVVITDFRSLDKVPIGNRFLIYTLFPKTNISIRLQWGPGKKFVAVTLGHNIFNKTSRTNCGQICSEFGGGGHKGAAACPLKPDKAEKQIAEIIKKIRED